MAWYRAGGGGIPASVKTDMNNVLNKKMGTTGQTYPPKEWADDVNLMGMLKEKTISGAVASCSDGADAVPLKNWGVTVDPTLSGVSSVVCTQAGKNLLAKDIVRYSNSLATLSDCFAIHHGTYTVTIGTVENANNWRLSVLLMDGEGNALTDNSYKPSNDLQLATNRWRYGSNTTNKTFTVTIVTDCYIRFFIELGDTSSSTTVTDSYLESGSTSTTYTPYIAPTVKTVSLGRTIYGGSVDVAAGTGTDGYNKITLSSLLTDLNVAQIGTTGVYRIRFSIADAKGAVNSAVFNGLCDYYTPLSANQTYNKNEGISINTSGQCYIYDSRFNTSTSLNDFKTWIDANPVALCYELATPTDFTFTPITPTPETALGANNFWADEGDSEVVYRSSGTVTPIVPVLTTKNITENGTYSAEDDDADGYSSVTVNVPQGSTIPFEKVWSSGDTGAETFTCTEAGKYLFMVGTSARGTATITSSVTADFTASKQGSDGRGLVIAVYTLAVGDTVTMTNTIVDWVYRTKVAFKTSLSVSATIDSAIVTDGTLSSFSPTFTGNALFIYMAGGRADTNSYDRTYATDNFEWASKMETQTFIRLSYGSNTPTPSIYGYDGGCALAICLQ